ncbi:phage GP46 family protein [Asaia astilbis]|uniref:phage GP46 family protein n=1 Tax=Asaia astilbis TaxID=610244 RepID=UPI00047258EA|nr:phage GP46 family protein [Asaia astilbis]
MDVGITWHVRAARGEWSIASGDLALENPLRSSIIVSLFTDRVLPKEPDALDIGVGIKAPRGARGTAAADLGGWWGDMLEEQPIGSRLRQLQRAIKVEDDAIPAEAEAICREALQWLIADGVAEDVGVSARWSTVNASALEFSITVKRPSIDSSEIFLFSWAWEGLV